MGVFDSILAQVYNEFKCVDPSVITKPGEKVVIATACTDPSIQEESRAYSQFLVDNPTILQNETLENGFNLFLKAAGNTPTNTNTNTNTNNSLAQLAAATNTPNTNTNIPSSTSVVVQISPKPTYLTPLSILIIIGSILFIAALIAIVYFVIQSNYTRSINSPIIGGKLRRKKS